METIALDWTIGPHEKREKLPGVWYPATVPGAVQLDIAAAEDYGPYYYGENWERFLWMEDSFFSYRSEFVRPQLEEGERLFFTSRGIDYHFQIRMNGKLLKEQEGMFTPVRLDVTDLLQDRNELLVTIFPAPKSHSESRDRTQADQSVKPAVSYGWDWHPRLIPLGIWDETRLEVVPGIRIDDLSASYTFPDDMSLVQGEFRYAGKGLFGQNYQVSLQDPDGGSVFFVDGSFESDSDGIPFILEDPMLWWPHDHGEQHRYTAVLSILDDSGCPVHERRCAVGFRRVRLVMNEGAWEEPSGFPKTRSIPPITMEVNGRRIFCKGTNWINPEIFPGTISYDRYEELLRLAAEANFNLLRVWGGAIVNKEAFFDLCDEMGLMVWQEFPLACNNYRGSDHYLQVLEQEAVSIISRLSRHPSLAMWCGGNELFNVWSGMTDQSAALRLLNSLCYRMDRETPFIMTSPLMGMGHGHYVFRDDASGREVFQIFAEARNSAYTEFGISSPSDVDILKMIIPEEELWPPEPGTSWESHHAFGAWQGDTWLRQGMIEDYFGPQESLEDLVRNGQFLQAEGYRFIFEEARRQKPACAMVLNWCYNDAWPSAANNSILNYPARPKPAYYTIREACRPVLASARIPKFLWTEGEEFTAGLWILNDSAATVPAGKLRALLRMGSTEVTLLEWNFGEAAANESLAGPSVRFRLPAFDADRFTLVLKVEDRPELDSVYPVLYRPREQKVQEGPKVLNL